MHHGYQKSTHKVVTGSAIMTSQGGVLTDATKLGMRKL